MNRKQDYIYNVQNLCNYVWNSFLQKQWTFSSYFPINLFSRHIPCGQNEREKQKMKRQALTKLTNLFFQLDFLKCKIKVSLGGKVCLLFLLHVMLERYLFGVFQSFCAVSPSGPIDRYLGLL